METNTGASCIGSIKDTDRPLKPWKTQRLSSKSSKGKKICVWT